MQPPTLKLYDEDSHLQQFHATVLSCHAEGSHYLTVLDRTAFFATGGGQNADTGSLDQAHVTEVTEHDHVFYHHTDLPLPVGKTVIGKINWEQRFRRMQGHSGEHIVSGLIYRLHNLHNVGFHMGSDSITADFNGVLTREQLDEIEMLANQAIIDDLPVTISYPPPDQLASLSYRSKLELTENVRIVTIGNLDACACCAPHVSHTGEIQMIRILDGIHYKKGIRLHILCGLDAFDDYRERCRRELRMANILSSKQSQLCSAVEQLSQTLVAQRQNFAQLEKQYAEVRAASLPESQGNHLLFETEYRENVLCHLAQMAATRCSGIGGAFAGNDQSEYRFILCSRHVDLRQLLPSMKTALQARGGGTSEMLRGNLQASREEIVSFFHS